jgi:hypothetical protein
VSPHLPYAYSDEDEFLHPLDGWLLLDRAVVYDSWISWRHVLPRGSRDCQALSGEVNNAILALAAELHAIHQRLPSYRDLGESPFHVTRWWDPFSEDSWSSGKLCIFSLDGLSSDEFIVHWLPVESDLHLEALSDTYVRARLLKVPAENPGAPRPGAAPPRGRGRSRKRPSPPPGTPDCAQPSAQLVP